MPRDSESLRPGIVHVYGPKGSVALGIGVFARKNSSGQMEIHITGGRRFHTWVTNNRSSERYHRTLFRNLRRVLIENGAWRYGDEGSETEGRAEKRRTAQGQ